MIFGNADFMGYPWETIVKIYRAGRGADSEDTIAAWSESFFTFLSSFGNIRPADKAENLMVSIASYFYELRTTCRSISKENRITINSGPYKNLLLQLIEQKTEVLSKESDWLSIDETEQFSKKYGSIIDTVVTQLFEHYQDKRISAAARKLFDTAVFKNNASPRHSGVVIAGFGDKEYFPTLVEYNTDGYIGDKVKVFHSSTVDISRDTPAGIRAFAQKEMVQRFMNGVDGHLVVALFELFHKGLSATCLEVLNKYGAEDHKTETTRNAIDRRLM